MKLFEPFAYNFEAYERELNEYAEMKRLKWRINNTVINSKHIYCYTYDQLYYFFDKRLNYLRF